MHTIGWVVYDPDDVIVAVRASRAEAARDVRAANRALDRSVIGPSYRWRYVAHRIPLDGSDPLEAALRTGVCVGCQDGRVPVQPSDDA